MIWNAAMACWFSALPLAACGRLDFTLQPPADSRVDVDVDVGVDADGAVDVLAPFGVPQPMMTLNTAFDDSDPALRADGLEIVFHSLRPGVGGYDLYRALRATTADPFGPPAQIAELNTTGDDGWPNLASDGLTLFFSDGRDILFATRPSLGATFGAAQPLSQLSSNAVDTTPGLSGDGLVAMVTRGTLGAREIWSYTRATDGPPTVGWSAGVRVAELGSPVADVSPDLDTAGLIVYFHSDRGGDDDIYVARRGSTSDPFGAPELVTELSSADDDGDPTLTSDLRTIMFHRRLELYIATR